LSSSAHCFYDDAQLQCSRLHFVKQLHYHQLFVFQRTETGLIKDWRYLAWKGIKTFVTKYRLNLLLILFFFNKCVQIFNENQVLWITIIIRACEGSYEIPSKQARAAHTVELFESLKSELKYFVTDTDSFCWHYFFSR